MERMILELEHVSHLKGKFRLQEISFSLPAGYLMGLVGKNGAGKTTLLKTILSGGARQKRYDGCIRIDGKEIHKGDVAFLNQIGFVSEDQEFFEDRTGRQNVELLGGFYENFDRAVFEKTMKKMELSPGKTYGKMSRGERMKFQMAFAMAHKPCLYLLDEVTAGMDPVFRMEFFKIIHEVIEMEEASVLMTSHIESEMQQHLDYVGFLEDGQLVKFGENREELWK